MKRFAAGVLLAVLLTLFVAIITSTSERASDQETTVLMVAVECPCGGVCGSCTQVVSDYAPECAEAEIGAVFRFPVEYIGSPRNIDSLNDWVTVENSGRGSGRALEQPYYMARNGDNMAAITRGHFSVGVL